MRMTDLWFWKLASILETILDGYLDIQRKMSKLYLCIFKQSFTFWYSYFLQLSKQLGTRFNEYKKCIWEIERTAEAWTQNKVQSPQGKQLKSEKLKVVMCYLYRYCKHYTCTKYYFLGFIKQGRFIT